MKKKLYFSSTSILYKRNCFDTDIDPSTMGSTIYPMYRRYKPPLPPPTPRQVYSVCTVEVILDNSFTELVFCGLSCFPFGLHHYLTLSTLWKEMEIVEKAGGWPVSES